MIPIESIIIFVAASAVLSISPGPDNIFVLAQSAMNGRKAGLIITLGLCTGLIIHTILVSLGIAAIFQTSEQAFTILKFIGALYLMYLAFQAFKADTTKLNDVKANPVDRKKLYFRGIVMNITNPKVAIFFLAFLPQFVDSSLGNMAVQMAFFGGLFIIIALIIFSIVAWSAGFLGEWLQKSKQSQKIIHKLAGTIFIGLAIKLAISER